MFDIDNIMKASLLFFLSTIPLIVLCFDKKQTPGCEKTNKDREKDNEELWEEATQEDLRSGNYDVL